MATNFDFIKDSAQRDRFQKYALLTGITEPLENSKNKKHIQQIPAPILESSAKYFSVRFFNLVNQYRKTQKKFIDRAAYNTKTFRRAESVSTQNIQLNGEEVSPQNLDMNPLNMSNFNQNSSQSSTFSHFNALWSILDDPQAVSKASKHSLIRKIVTENPEFLKQKLTHDDLQPSVIHKLFRNQEDSKTKDGLSFMKMMLSFTKIKRFQLHNFSLLVS